jgi:hypothetical protein
MNCFTEVQLRGSLLRRLSDRSEERACPTVIQDQQDRVVAKVEIVEQPGMDGAHASLATAVIPTGTERPLIQRVDQ